MLELALELTMERNSLTLLKGRGIMVARVESYVQLKVERTMASTVQQLNNRHRRMMEALVLEGKRPVEVAIEFSITESRLSILRRSPLWKAEEDALSRDVRDQHKSSILRLIPKAIDKAEELLNCGDVKVEATVYKDLLTRA